MILIKIRLVYMKWTKEKQVLAEMVRGADKINGKTVFAKMVCYLQKERGEKLDYQFDNNFPRGHYTYDFDNDLRDLIEEGFIKEDKVNVPYARQEKCVYSLGNKKLENNLLTETTKKRIKSIIREYAKRSGTELSVYDHELYRNKIKFRSSFELRDYRKNNKRRLLEETGNNAEKAFDLFLNEKEFELKKIRKMGITL